MKTLKLINKHLISTRGIEIERVSNMDSITREPLSGIRFILRGGGFDEDFETFKDVKQFVNKLGRNKWTRIIFCMY